MTSLGKTFPETELELQMPALNVFNIRIDGSGVQK